MSSTFGSGVTVEQESVFAYTRVQILNSSYDHPTDKNIIRAQLRLYTDSSSKFAWADLPVNTVYCVKRSLDEIMAEVKIGYRDDKFVYEEVRFPVGDDRNEWFRLEPDED